MKRALIGIATMIVSTAALAVVTDSFKCELEVTELETNNRVVRNDGFFVSRLPAGTSPDGSIQITEANAGPSVSFDSNKAYFGVSLYMGYSHAVKYDALGQPMEARQKSCFTISTSYCKKEESQGGRAKACSSGATLACPSDGNGPFDPNSYWWHQVPLLDGVPLFNGDALRQMESFILDENGNYVGYAKVNCSHLGTFK
ncbi:MAG: hypothetical protein WCI18_05595 [Pseudomonadota bacterium]